MKPLTLKFSDTEAIDLLKVLKEKKNKHQTLYTKAKQRAEKPKPKGNPALLMSKHEAVKLKVDALINKIVEQI